MSRTGEGEGEAHELEAWLTSKGLAKYCEGIMSTGVTKPNELVEFTESDLKELGDELEMPKLIRRRFIRAVDALCPELEKKSSTQQTPNSAGTGGMMYIPMGPEEQTLLQKFGKHIQYLQTADTSFGEALKALKEASKREKLALEANFDALIEQIQEQKKEALDCIAAVTAEAIAEVETNDCTSSEAIKFSKAAHMKCLKALQIRDFSELSKRQQTISQIVDEALSKDIVKTEVVSHLKVCLSKNFEKVKNGESLVIIEAPILNTKGGKIWDYTAVFTTLGASGRTGPESLGSQYNGQDHEKAVRVEEGMQYWTVPQTGIYEIDASGAEGGTGNGPGGGKGARICGRVRLKKDQVVTILVGQNGGDGILPSSSSPAGGGGGGSFIVSENSALLVVAGGNGGNYSAWKTGGPDGRSLHGDGGGEYKRDNNIQTNGRGGRGGSFKKTDDVPSCSGYEQRAGSCFVDGGNGGDHSYGVGGFGGGGAPQHEGGGGGGYFGGVVVNTNQYSSRYPHYSATSFICESGQVVSESNGYKTGDGAVSIKLHS